MKKKYKIYGCADRYLIKLLAIKESNKGELTITSFRSGAHILNSQRLKIIDEHFTIHYTKEKSHTHITYKINFGANESMSIAANVKDSSDYLCWLIYVRRVPYPAWDRIVRHVHASDSVLRVYPYDPNKWTMMYSVFVVNPSFSVQDMSDNYPKYNFVEAAFKNYKVIMIYSFVRIPSLYRGSLTSYTTSSPQLNNVNIFVKEKISAHSVGYGNLFGAHLKAMKELAGVLALELKKGRIVLNLSELEIDKKTSKIYNLPDPPDPIYEKLAAAHAKGHPSA